MPDEPVVQWHEIEPKDAVDIDLSERLDIEAPPNEMGERCPWPWGPQQLVGAPLGQHHCQYCGAMCMAGAPHPDYRTESGRPWLDEVDDEIAEIDRKIAAGEEAIDES